MRVKYIYNASALSANICKRCFVRFRFGELTSKMYHALAKCRLRRPTPGYKEWSTFNDSKDCEVLRHSSYNRCGSIEKVWYDEKDLWVPHKLTKKNIMNQIVSLSLLKRKLSRPISKIDHHWRREMDCLQYHQAAEDVVRSGRDFKSGDET